MGAECVQRLVKGGVVARRVLIHDGVVSEPWGYPFSVEKSRSRSSSSSLFAHLWSINAEEERRAHAIVAESVRLS